MLYHILYGLSGDYSWLNVFKYQTFRAMAAFLLSFFFVLLLQPVYISWLKKKGIKGQPIQADGPDNHQSKSGTPTMGGLLIVGAVVLSAVLLADLTNKFVWFTLFVLVSYAWLGFVDDWSKVTKQDNAGLTERKKLFWQTGIAFVAVLALYLFDFPTTLSVPFLKEILPELGLLFIPFAMLVIIGTSNAVNLTDGLDGLAIGPVMTVAGVYSIFAYLTGHVKLAEYLAISYVPGIGELCIILSAIIAAGLGFLWYNTFPAQVFMGDIGALSLGAALGFVAVLVKHEILLVVAGGVFVIETLSVIIQRYSYKLRKKRVFKMAPIHHHFELKGWAEPKIIVRFWIISIILALISLTTLKLR